MDNLIEKVFQDELGNNNLPRNHSEILHDESCSCKECKSYEIKVSNAHPLDCQCEECEKENGIDSIDEEFFWGPLSFWGDLIANQLKKEDYKVPAGREYGGRWKSQSPPGLPAWVRKSSISRAALPRVEQEARKHNLGNTFIKAVKQMALSESGATFALPARNFNANPPSLRPPGKGLITAWGVFQFNRDAWTSVIPGSSRSSRRSFKPKGDSGCGYREGCVYPWDTNSSEEIAIPIKKYANLFKEVKSLGGSDADAAAGLRIWHISPNRYNSWKSRGRSSTFNSAWNGLPLDFRSRIRSFLRKANIQAPHQSEISTPLDQEFWGTFLPNLFSSNSSSKIIDRTAFSPKSKRIRDRDLSSVYALVLHAMGFNRGNDPNKYNRVTAHFIILRDGKIYQLHPLKSYLYSSNGFNRGSVAVEFAGNFKSTRNRCYKPDRFGCHDLTTAQINAGRNLVKYLIGKIGLTHILAHRQSSGSRSNDPGPEIWKNIGQWAVNNYKLDDGGPNFKIDSGRSIPDDWR